MADPVYNVLFLCTGNTARSTFGEAILNHEGAGRFKALSAGSHPRAAIHPYALDLLRQLNHPLDDIRSKSWGEFSTAAAPRLDFAFTVCDDAVKETCPIWPGQPMSAHWGMPDPVAAEGTEAERRLAFAEAYRMLKNRIAAFTSLIIASLDRLSLKNQLDTIGKN